MGVVPCRIDILTGISGISFDAAWPKRVVAEVDGVTLPFLGRLGRDDLIANKRASGRLKDLADVEALEPEKE